MSGRVSDRLSEGVNEWFDKQMSWWLCDGVSEWMIERQNENDKGNSLVCYA
jgi:hypothetical protein